MRIKLIILLICLMVMTLALPAWSAVYKDTVNHWSEQSVLKMNAKGLIQGDGQGKFYPETPVSRQEIITLIVRLINKENVAKTLQQNTTTTAKGLSNWAAGYLEVAKQEGIVTDSELKTLTWNGAAERQEVALWLSKAVELTPLSSDTEKILAQFKDENKINIQKVPYIVPLVKDSIFVGSNGYFRPLDSIKRAEVAALLDRADAKYLAKTIIRSKQGQIATLGNNRSDIIIRDTEGRTSTFTTTTQTIFYKNSKKITELELTDGDWLEYVSNSSNRLSYAEVITAAAIPAPTTGLVCGKINSLLYAATSQITVLDINNRLRTYDIESNTSFTLNGKTITLTNLNPGQWVTLNVVNGRVDTIAAITTGTTIKGKLTDINLQSGALKIEVGGNILYFEVSSNLMAQLENTINQVKSGNSVELTFINGIVSTIKVLSEPVNATTDNLTIYKAFLKTIDTQEDSIKLQSGTVMYLDNYRWRSELGSITMDMGRKAEIYYDGDEIEFYDLEDFEGDTIYLAYDENKDEVIKVWVQQGREYTYDDEISNINTLNERFELKNQDNRLYYNDGTIVLKNGKLIDGEELEKGSDVFIVIDKDGSIYDAAVVVVE